MGVTVVDALKEAACVHTRWEDVKKARASAAKVSAGSGIGSADEANERSELIVTAVNLIASIPARAETVDEVRALLVEYGAHVLAMAGAERFEVYVDRDNPTTVVVVERYADDQAFAEHLADPANAVLNEALADLTDGGSSLQFLTPA